MLLPVAEHEVDIAATVGTPAAASWSAYAASWRRAGNLSVRASLVSTIVQPDGSRTTKSANPWNRPSKKAAW